MVATHPQCKCFNAGHEHHKGIACTDTADATSAARAATMQARRISQNNGRQAGAYLRGRTPLS